MVHSTRVLQPNDDEDESREGQWARHEHDQQLF